MRRLLLVQAAALAILAGCGTATPSAPGAPEPHPRGGAEAAGGGRPAAAVHAPRTSAAHSEDVHPRAAVAGWPASGGLRRLVISSRGIDAPVVPVRFAGSRLAIPASIGEVGDWVGGARLGDAVGATVLVGHVSDDHDRPGVLGRLAGIRAGEVIALVPRHGPTRRFVVTRVRSYAKEHLPRSAFAQTGPHRLVLITCSHRVDLPGGGFHYQRNLVVTARPR